KIALLSAALQEHNADLQFLLSLLRAPQIPLRLAAIDAVRDRKEPEILAELVGMTAHPESRIRLKLAEMLQPHTDKAAVKALHALIRDLEASVREAAIKSTSGRHEFRTAHENCLANDTYWSVRFAAVNALDAQNSPHVVKTLWKALQDEDNDIARR